MGKIYLDAEGYKMITLLPDGRVAALLPQLFNVALRAGLDVYGYSESYSYESYEAAVSGLTEWSGKEGTEPEGWIRHQPSNRRRTDGDAETEYIRA